MSTVTDAFEVAGARDVERVEIVHSQIGRSRSNRFAVAVPTKAPKTFCRVAPGDRSPGAPTDPDVRDSRIRLVRARVRYVAYRRAMRGGGSGKRSSKSSSCFQSTYPVLERRESHLRQACRVSRKKRASARSST